MEFNSTVRLLPEDVPPDRSHFIKETNINL